MATRRMGTLATVFMMATVIGCASRNGAAAPPPCPVFNSAAITDYVRILEWEDTNTIGHVRALHEWLEDQLTFCKGLDAYRESLRD